MLKVCLRTVIVGYFWNPRSNPRGGTLGEPLISINFQQTWLRSQGLRCVCMDVFSWILGHPKPSKHDHGGHGDSWMSVTSTGPKTKASRGAVLELVRRLCRPNRISDSVGLVDAVDVFTFDERGLEFRPSGRVVGPIRSISRSISLSS